MVMVDNMGYVSDMGRPSTFTNDQMVNIVLLLGKLKNVSGGSLRSIMALPVTPGRSCHQILPNSPPQIQ